MVKEMLLIRRKPGMSREDFIKHYEEVHAPLILRMCPYVKKYARNYVQSGVMGEAGFDCITEVWYEDMAGFQALGQLYTAEEGKPIRESEASFLDESSMVVVLVDENVSEASARR